MMPGLVDFWDELGVGGVAVGVLEKVDVVEEGKFVEVNVVDDTVELELVDVVLAESLTVVIL